MTWIIGRSGPFGHAVGISDIRVTLQDGSEFDCLQKIYRIAGNMAMGFSGSVQIGLEVMSQISTALNIEEENRVYDPFFIAENFYIGTKIIYKKYARDLPNPTTHFILFSAHPRINDGAAPWAKCFIHRFRSPLFEPEVTRQGVIVSIGSGSCIEEYKKALGRLGEDTDVFQLELGVPGGSGLGLMMSLTKTLKALPKPGISQYLQTVIVGRNSVRISNNFALIKDNSGKKTGNPPLAQNIKELMKIFHENSVSSIHGATC